MENQISTYCVRHYDWKMVRYAKEIYMLSRWWMLPYGGVNNGIGEDADVGVSWARVLILEMAMEWV